ncbi:MAG: GNAT family N-acetyltransferase [Defluviitaleaceae bacterium]|nr:GNAT family N-acetyltransferase [Defluviitaleaceae bacterium]
MKTEKSLYNQLTFCEVEFSNADQSITLQKEIFQGFDATLLVLAACDLKLFKEISKMHMPFGKLNYYLAFKNGEAVGITGIYTYSDKGKPNECWLAWYGVHERFRNQGYGRSILEWTIHQAIAEGYEILRIYTAPQDHADADKLYLKMGFTKEEYSIEFEGIYTYSIAITDVPLELMNGRFMNFALEIELCEISEDRKNAIVEQYVKKGIYQKALGIYNVPNWNIQT